MSEAVHLIQSAAIEPDVAKTIDEAFHAEWARMQPAFDDWRPLAVEAARISLAKVALHLVRQGVTEPDALRKRMRLVMKRSHTALADRQCHH